MVDVTLLVWDSSQATISYRGHKTLHWLLVLCVVQPVDLYTWFICTRGNDRHDVEAEDDVAAGQLASNQCQRHLPHFLPLEHCSSWFPSVHMKSVQSDVVVAACNVTLHKNSTWRSVNRLWLTPESLISPESSRSHPLCYFYKPSCTGGGGEGGVFSPALSQNRRGRERGGKRRPDIFDVYVQQLTGW